MARSSLLDRLRGGSRLTWSLIIVSIQTWLLTGPLHRDSTGSCRLILELGEVVLGLSTIGWEELVHVLVVGGSDSMHLSLVKIDFLEFPVIGMYRRTKNIAFLHLIITWQSGIPHAGVPL